MGKLWKELHPEARVVAETATSSRHPGLRALGLEARTRAQPFAETEVQAFPFVLFSVPPSAIAADEEQDIERAAALLEPEGSFLLVSSTGVYAEEEGGVVKENSRLGTSERARALLKIEHEASRWDAAIVRMAGIYGLDRGPQRAYAAAVDSDLRPDGIINLIHEQDAAELCVKILLRPDRKPAEIFLGCDDSPITRAELVELSKGQTRFKGTAGPLGKRCDNSWTRSRTRWQPRFRSFAEGMSITFS